MSKSPDTTSRGPGGVFHRDVSPGQEARRDSRSRRAGEQACWATSSHGDKAGPHGSSSGAKSDDGKPKASGERTAPPTATGTSYKCHVSSPTRGVRPIAIELPKGRHLNPGRVSTPPEPLSGRGDIQGAFFPLHEDPKTRVYRPHPFHTETQSVKKHPIDRATQTNKWQEEAEEARSAAGAFAMADSSHPGRPMLGAVSSASSRANTPVASYMPSGIHANPVSMGKYYPSNYENRKKDPLRATPATLQGRHSPSKMKAGEDYAAQKQSEPESQRLMQQYRRDMITQTAMARSQAIARQERGGSSGQNPAFGRRPGPRKPTSPRLAPLGSPGPVTPMDLEGADPAAGYLNQGQSVSAAGMRRVPGVRPEPPVAEHQYGDSPPRSWGRPTDGPLGPY